MLFDSTQERTLEAVLDRLIPPDNFPGAWDAGVGDYIALQLQGELKHLLPTYQAGLQGLDDEAMLQYGRTFAELTPDEQEALLLAVEAENTQAEWRTPPGPFFSTLVNHTAEGYYADPGQGGNRDKTSWKMIGFNGR